MYVDFKNNHNFENLITNESVDPYSPFFKTLCIYKISFLDLPARMKWEQIHIQALKDVINQVDRGKFALLLKEPTHVHCTGTSITRVCIALLLGGMINIRINNIKKIAR